MAFSVVSFAGGQTPAKTGLGLVGMPLILSSTAARGHHITLIMGGGAPVGREGFVVSGLESARTRKEGAGTFGIVCYRASTKWSFCPQLLWRLDGAVRSCDFVSLHSVYCFPVLAGFLLAKLYGKPYGLWPHGALAPFQRGVSKHIKWIYDRLVARRMLNGASVLFFSAPGERDEVLPLHLKAPAAIVPHGIDTSEFEALPPKGRFRDRFLKGHDGPLVIFLARLNPKKGVDLLVQAMARVLSYRPDSRLVIAGQGDPKSFENQVQDWVRSAGIQSKTLLTGHIDAERKRELLADADVLVLPSQAENFGFSIFEAMASGVPVVVSDTVNYASLIEEKGAGFSRPRRPEAFAESILRLIDEPSLRRRMGDNGSRLARSFSWERNGALVERIIDSILHGHPVTSSLGPESGTTLPPVGPRRETQTQNAIGNSKL